MKETTSKPKKFQYMVHCRSNEAILQKLDAIAKQANTTRSGAIRKLIEKEHSQALQ
jgi:hypothetical protein